MAVFNPNCRSGASAIARTTTAQFGLVTIRPCPAVIGGLCVEQLQMIRVDLGDEQRDGLLHPVVSRVADDDVPGSGEGRFDLTGHGGIEAGEHERGARPDAAASTVRRATSSGRRRGQPPGGRVAVRLALRSLAGAEPRDAEPRVVREEGDELLADHAGRAKNADGNCSHGDSFQKKSRRGKPCRRTFWLVCLRD